jgi:hypothetical protein
MNKLKFDLQLFTNLSLAFLLIYIVFLINAYPVSLPSADLGRHIMNGEILYFAISNWDMELLYKILHTNFYSYTQSNFDFVNHHWLTGVFYYFVDKSWGMTVLTFLNIVFIVLANFFFFLSARLLSNTNFALLLTVIALPITCMRSEVRPESISYFFLALIIYFLVLYDKERISFFQLALFTTVIQLFWINSHIFFFLGIFAMFCYGLKYLIAKDKDKIYKFLLLGIIVCLVSLLNPHGLTGLLYPLNIFKGYGYSTAENQSVLFMQFRNPNAINYYYYELLLLISIFLALVFRKKLDLALLVFTFAMLILGLKTNRAMTLGAFAFIPFVASISELQFLNKHSSRILLLTFIASCSFIGFYQGYSKKKVTDFYFNDRVNQSALFFKQMNIQGPIFNNFDIGGYLIYHLFPDQRVFVDNRPEAYEEKFMQEIYLGSLKDDSVWQELDKKINFNSIFFYRHDMTEHGQPFLIRRIRDPLWIPVFVDDNNIILLKNNSNNQSIIEKFALPESIFKVIN